LKPCIKNCGQTAAQGDIDSLWTRHRPVQWHYYRPLRLTTYRL